MKKFKNFKEFSDYVNETFKTTNNQSTGTIAEQWYKDSREYTYIQEEIMYKSGQVFGDFKDGLIIEKTPYVRRRYYEGGKGKKNPKAMPLWFEVTKKQHIQDYKKMWTKEFEEAKK